MRATHLSVNWGASDYTRWHPMSCLEFVMRRVAAWLIGCLWVVLLAGMMIVPACATDPVMRLVSAALVFYLLPYLWWRVVSGGRYE